MEPVCGFGAFSFSRMQAAGRERPAPACAKLSKEIFLLYDFTKEKFDILIQAGQSNSYGYGFGDASRPFEDDDRVFYLTGRFMIVPATEQISLNAIQGNYSLAFARAYIADGLLEEGRKLLILRTSEGGTGFSDHRWDKTGDLYLRMMEMVKTALSLNPENRVAALLWHQGETDVDNGMSEAEYTAHLRGLVQAVREVCENPGLPFIAGDFTEQWRGERGERCFPIQAGLRQICAEGNGAFVETDGLLSNVQQNGNEYTIHFSRDALYGLGERYFSAFCGLKKQA